VASATRARIAKKGRASSRWRALPTASTITALLGQDVQRQLADMNDREALEDRSSGEGKAVPVRRKPPDRHASVTLVQ
jgi:hypothetical protein